MLAHVALVFAAEAVRDGLTEVDPEGKAEYRANAEAYLKKLDRLDKETKAKLASIPEQRRVLVTSHDAFRYLGDGDAMDPARPLSAAGTLVIEARVSASGDAMRASGDPIGTSAPVTAGSGEITVRIDRRVP